MVKRRPCTQFMVRAGLCCSPGLKSPIGERQAGPKLARASPQQEPSTTTRKPILPPTACPGQSSATTPSPPQIQIWFCAQKISSREEHKKPTLPAKTPLFPLRPAAYPSSYRPGYKLSAKPAMPATRACSTSRDLARHLGARDTGEDALQLFSATTAVTSMQLWETGERYNSWASFDTQSSSLWQLDLNFGFRPVPSDAPKSESTPSTIREQEWPEDGQHGTWAQSL